jgi:Tfp pilus assembly protein FimT
MKTCSKRPSNRQRGLSLIETLVYMAVFVVVLGCATAVFFQSWTDSKALHRNATDILGALHAGDQWRADVRSATGPMQILDASDAQQLHIPTTNGEIVYAFAAGQLRRQAAGDAISRLWLDHVKSSRMQADARPNVAAARWELELQSSLKTAKFHPLFTFQAVVGGGVAR